jgi:putative flavoprotein involved in K+ transport
LQLHSHHYRNPSQLQGGGVLVVGLGNSGADIGIEIAQTHPTWISGKESGHIPWPIESFIARFFLVRLVRFMGHHVLTVRTRLGRKLRPKMLHQATPLVRVKPKDLLNAGIQSVPKVVGVKDGLPLLADDRTLEVKNIVWCTGYEHGFPWIDLPVWGGETGTIKGTDPLHEEGIVPSVPGLFFVGLHFLYAMTSATLIGVGRDAERIVNAVAVRTQEANARKRPSIKAFPRSGLVAASDQADIA